MNIVIIKGNLTHDVILRQTKTGKFIAEISIAVNERSGDNNYVSFFNVQAWDKTASTIAEHFKKGDPILIEGRLKQERWENTEGKPQSKIIIVMNRFEFCGGKRTEEANDKDCPAPHPDSNSAPFSDEPIPF